MRWARWKRVGEEGVEAPGFRTAPSGSAVEAENCRVSRSTAGGESSCSSLELVGGSMEGLHP